MIELMPIMCTAKMVNATLAPPCSISGGYMVQPPAGAPPGRNSVPSSMTKANGRIQNDQLFMRGRAMSGAAVCSGIIQLPRPTKAGMIAPKIITSACMVVIWLKNWGSTSCRPGIASSLRITTENPAPMITIVKLKSRYSVPMSLWLVEKNQRSMKPCLGPWSSWTWAPSAAAGYVDMMLPTSDAWSVCACGRSACRGDGGLRVHPRGGGSGFGLGLRGGRGLHGRGCGRGGRRRRVPGPLRRQPLAELGLGHRLHHDRHEAVVLAAKLGALAAVDALPLDVGPGLVDDAGDRVLLPAQRRHPPGVDDVVGGDHEADLGVDRQHQHVVDLEQVVRHLLRVGALPALADAVVLLVQAAGERD